MTENRIIRASEIGMWTYCPKSFLLLRRGVKAQQTLQDLQKQKIIPAQLIRQLQEKHHLPPSTPVDKIIGQGLLSPKIERKIIKQNIMLQGTAKHQDIGKQTQAHSMVAEHRGGYTLALIIILIIIGFLVMILVQGGGMP